VIPIIRKKNILLRLLQDDNIFDSVFEAIMSQKMKIILTVKRFHNTVQNKTRQNQRVQRTRRSKI
jgi:hypothetical protein